ncbi:MAG: hypothetical protein JW700_02315 [Candidatus Aenigmarchaeota archaeon]|nr:hypothetical protein [Candidatus Aenigmarchaeota archaeon]
MFFVIFVFRIMIIGGANSFEDSLVVYGAILFVLLSLSFVYANSFPNVPFIGNGENLIILVSMALIITIFWSAYKIGSGKPQKS